ncbi:UNVERIFIED_CONTAM: hypothetical protein RMT77_002070, partial [Armadillidium vulgare]
ELNLETPVEQQRASLRQVSLRKKRIVQGPTNKETLMKLKDKHPLPGIVLEWRRINSALTKVVYPLSQEMVSCVPLGEERIFAVCHTFTATGRVTFHEPNVQNIPKDFVIELPDQENKKGDKNARAKVDFTPVMRQLAPFLDPVQCSTTYTVSLRHSIVAGKNRILLAADYSQLELRILAHLSSDSHLLKVLNDGEDVFKNIASQIYSIEVGEVTNTMRQEAKQICYGIIYGMSDKTLGEQLDITEEEAKDFMKQFHGKFPSISKFIQGTVEEARKNGYVVTLEKRKRFLPEINSPSLAARGQSERQAVNTCIQGSAADIVKKALISIQESLVENFTRTPLTLTQRLKGEETLSGGYLILQLHDELIYEVSNDDVIQVAQIVKISMENTVKLSVSLPVKIKVGPTWGSMQTLNL